MRVVKIVFLTFLVGCTHLLYQPSKLVFHRPHLINLDKKNVTWTAEDGTRLEGWIVFDPHYKGLKKGLIAHFHGNAENLTSHYLSMAWMTQHGFDLMVFDYRGYGTSEGKSNPKGVYLDSLSALEYAHKLVIEQKYKNFIIMGQSLGGSLVLKALSVHKHIQKDVDLVILDSTFRSNAQVSAALLRSNFITFLFSPLAYLLVHDTYNATQSDLEEWNIPTLIVTHLNDPVVKSYQSKQIFTVLGKNVELKKKWLWMREEEPSGHINSFFYPNGPWNQKLLTFINEMEKN